MDKASRQETIQFTNGPKEKKKSSNGMTLDYWEVRAILLLLYVVGLLGKEGGESVGEGGGAEIVCEGEQPHSQDGCTYSASCMTCPHAVSHWPVPFPG